MSVIPHPAQFRALGVKPLDPTNQATLDLALRLVAADPTDQATLDLALRMVLSLKLPPPISARRGADEIDCQIAMRRITSVTEAYMDFVKKTVEQVSENMPVTDTIDLKGFLACAEDARDDAVGLLQIAADKVSGV